MRYLRLVILFLTVLIVQIHAIEAVKDDSLEKKKSGSGSGSSKQDLGANGNGDSSKDSKSPNVDVEMPKLLTMADFDKVTSEHLSFVEFFSPYCSHCKALAPTWEKTYKEFYNELQSMNVQMRQVNCIESGDLCDREDVNSYPNLRIYSPVHDRKTGEKVGKLKNVASYPRSLVRSPENFKKFIKNSVSEYDNGSIDLPSASVKLSLDEILNLLAGNSENPKFIMFYPGTEAQWEESENTGRSSFAKLCYDCMENKRMWDKLSNQILTTVETHHFSCIDHKDLCESLGFKKLTVSGSNASPKFMMILPKSAGIIRFDYKGTINLELLKEFALSLYENSQFETVSAKTLSEIMDFRKSLPQEPLNLYYPLANKVSIVFYMDVNTVTEEDKAILPYILEYITYSPFNMHLYVAKSDKFERAINTQAMNLVEYINYDESQEKKVFNRGKHLATTLTTKPTLFIIKDNCLFTTVFQSYAPEDIRSFDKVKDFIEKNKHPLYQELTPQLLEHYFDKNDDTNSKVVITFIDSTDAKATDEALFRMSLAVHEYHYNKDEYYFNDILEKRKAKENTVEHLKEQNADSVKIIKEMRREVPHLFDNNQVLFTFVDIGETDEFANAQGWNINSRKYQKDDTIIVTKDNRYYYDEDLQGKPLKNDPTVLRDLLKYLLDPKLVEGSYSLNKKLVGSPYFSALRFMDQIHQRGFFAYVLLIVVIILLVKGINKFKSKSSNSGAIIGNLDKHD